MKSLIIAVAIMVRIRVNILIIKHHHGPWWSPQMTIFHNRAPTLILTTMESAGDTRRHSVETSTYEYFTRRRALLHKPTEC